MSWWNSITGLNQFYYCGALFFSVFFIWQLIAAFAGADGGDDADSGFGGDTDADGALDGAAIDDGMDATYAQFEDGAESDAIQSMAAFRIVSLRSLVTFFTLFFWGNALYTHNGLSFIRAFSYSTLWGLAGMISVAVVFYLLTRLSEEGTASLATCVGKEGTVYQDIPERGNGRVRTTVGHSISYVKARSVSGAAIDAGTRVDIVRQVEINLVEVNPREAPEEKPEGN